MDQFLESPNAFLEAFDMAPSHVFLVYIKVLFKGSYPFQKAFPKGPYPFLKAFLRQNHRENGDHAFLPTKKTF